MDKTTEDLQSELTRSRSFGDFCRKNSGELEFPSAAAYLNHLCRQKGISKAALVQASGLDRTYAYHILNGTKTPGRDKLLALAVAACANINETQTLLKYAQEAPLYVRDRRDGLIYHCILQRQPLYDINRLLEENGMKVLE